MKIPTTLGRYFKAVAAITLGLSLQSNCAAFETHSGEKLPFDLKVLNRDVSASTIIVSHGGGCRTAQDDTWASNFREWGYNVVLIDHCTARGILPHTGVEPPPLGTQDRVNDYIATAEWVKTQSWHKGKVGLFGISRGGEGVLRATDERFNRVRRGVEGLAEIDVYVALYPPCNVFPKAPRGPLLIMHGELDNLAVFGSCEYSTRVHKNLIIKTYPNAHHGFDTPGPIRYGQNRYLGQFIVGGYNAVAAAQSLRDAKNFLAENMR